MKMIVTSLECVFVHLNLGLFVLTIIDFKEKEIVCRLRLTKVNKPKYKTRGLVPVSIN